MKAQEHWAPPHECPRCGALVQWYHGPRRPFPTRMDAGTWRRHRCPADPLDPLPDQMLCLCGQQVRRVGNRTYDLNGREHCCPRKYPQAQRPQRPPSPCPEPNGLRPPRPEPNGCRQGYILLGYVLEAEGDHGAATSAP